MVILIKVTSIITLYHLIAIWEPEKYYVCGTVLYIPMSTWWASKENTKR